MITRILPKGWMLFLVVTVAMGLAGGAYAAWTTALHVEGTVTTGSVDAVWDMQDEVESVGIFDPATGQIAQRPIPEGKDVADCISDLEPGAEARTVNFQVINAYPSYTCVIIMGAYILFSCFHPLSTAGVDIADKVGSK